MMAHYHSRRRALFTPLSRQLLHILPHWSSIAVIALIAAATGRYPTGPDIHPRNAAPSQESRPATAAARRDVQGAVPSRRLRRYGGAGEWARAADLARTGAVGRAAVPPHGPQTTAQTPQRPLTACSGHLCASVWHCGCSVAVCAGAR